MTRRFSVHLAFAALLACTAAPLWAQPQARPLPLPDTPIAPEKNPPGDIPDNQVFVTYRSPLGFHVKVPEGWARRESAQGVQFADKYNSVQVQIEPQASAPTAEGARHDVSTRLQQQGRAIRIEAVRTLHLHGQPVVEVRYGSNSDPNPVTNKAIRLDNARSYFWDGQGHVAILTLSSPAGADNADQWKLIAASFGWK